MAKRRTRAELREEYQRLLEIWKYVRAYFVELYTADDFDKAEDSVPTAETLLAQFDERKNPASVLLSGLKASLEEHATGLAGALVHSEKTTVEFLNFYKASSGREFFDDMGDPTRKLKAIVKRGHLVSEDEFRLMKSVFDDDFDLLSELEMERAAKMLGDFEIEPEGCP